MTTAATAPAATPAWLADIEKAFDVLANANFAQIGDVVTSAITQAATDPVGAVETVANAIINFGAVAGNPIAVEAAAVAPVAEKLINFALSFTGLFSGATVAQASAISSPSGLAAQTPTMGVGHRTGIDPG